MANALYGLGRNRFAKGLLHWSTGGDTFRVGFLKTTYTPSIDTHEFFTDVSTYVVGNSDGSGRTDCPSLTIGSDPVLGVCDASDATVTSVSSTPGQLDYIFIFMDSGADATSPLVALIDTATGLPVTGNGGDINIVWDDGTNKIFKL